MRQINSLTYPSAPFKTVFSVIVLMGLLMTTDVGQSMAQQPIVQSRRQTDSNQDASAEFNFGTQRTQAPSAMGGFGGYDGGYGEYGEMAEEMDDYGGGTGTGGGGSMGMGMGGSMDMGMGTPDPFSSHSLIPAGLGGRNPFRNNRMTREQVIKQIEIYLKREKAQLDSLEDAIKTTSSDFQAATDNNAKSRLLRYLKVDVEAAFESKLKIQEAELYLLLGKILEIRDEHVAHAANREDLIARRIARLVSGSDGEDDSSARLPASLRKPDDLSKVQANASKHPTLANDKVRDVYRRNSIKIIGLAMHNFSATYRTFPGHANLKHGFPAKYRNKSGVVQPFSWRVAILPFIEEEELYNHYRFEEPWDSEHNRQLIDKMPAIFRSPFAPESQAAGRTNIQGFATRRGLMESANGFGFRSILDGSSNTILAVETAETVPWTKPVDLVTTKVKLIENYPLLVLMADGSVDVLPQPIDQDKLDKMITRDGGEVIR